MSNLNSVFPCAFSTDSSQHDNDATVITSNVSTPNIATHGLLDSGATDHFLAVNSHIINRQPSINKIKVAIPDGNKMTSSEECDIDWPVLPPEAKSGHILPSLKNHALISVVKLCDAGCEVVFKHNCCLVIYNKKIIMYGVRCPR